MTGTAESFENNRYLRVDQLISAETASLCTTYAKADEKHRYNSGDSLTQNSHSKYADFLMESLMVTLCPKIEKITGLSLTPTYSYFRVYKAGEELREHVDRPSCEISCSLCLGYDYLGKDYKWRLIVNGNKIALSPGDGVIYRGMELPHSRPRLQTREGSWHAQAFLHYIDNQGAYTSLAFDGREELYLPTVRMR
jgi:hypothetical protein